MWPTLFRQGGLASLLDRLLLPRSCPHQCLPAVEAAVCELRRAHPECGRSGSCVNCKREGISGGVPVASINPILHRRRLIVGRRAREKHSECVRRQREEAMKLFRDAHPAGPGDGRGRHSRAAAEAELGRRTSEVLRDCEGWRAADWPRRVPVGSQTARAPRGAGRRPCRFVAPTKSADRPLRRSRSSCL
jgi:hypothetical protein